METKKVLILRIRNRQIKWANNEEGRLGGFKTHKTYRKTKGHRLTQRDTYLMSMFEWTMGPEVGNLAKEQKSLRATNHRRLWKTITAPLLKRHGAQ